MSTANTACIILAAGKGTRMKSDKPKVLHEVAGLPMINHITKAAENSGARDICVVIAADMQESVGQAIAPHKTAIQKEQKGTGDAAKAAEDALKSFKGKILILIGDAPLITSETLNELQNAASATGLAVLGFEAADPYGYGRLIEEEEGCISAIVEEKDCSEDQKDITLCNAGNFCVDSDLLWQCLSELKSDNAQGEYYLTDIVKLAASKGIKCGLAIAHEWEAMGVNSRAQLADAEYIMQQRLREKAMEGGATLLDPETVYLSADTEIGRDVIIEPNVFIGPKVKIGDNVTIHAFTHLTETILENKVAVGPFSRLRGMARLDEGAAVGNFVEVKKTHFHAGAKAKHLAYLGDATIGKKTNISAGVITVNYDGFEKHHTTIGDNVMVGCDTTLVAPVTIGDGAYIAAGSAITMDVAPDALAVARNRPIIRDGWAAEYREKKKHLKDEKKAS
jgi:bifunctional UDP-N-acetylglucosamine pyrophosphorylase/glucosamine-1-phosphate N-acetyltransferase